MAWLIVAFKDVNYSIGIWASRWVGLENFQYLFATRDAWLITRNTLLYNGAFIIINTCLAIGVAVLLNEVKNKYAARFFQSAILLPFLISMVIGLWLLECRIRLY